MNKWFASLSAFCLAAGISLSYGTAYAAPASSANSTASTRSLQQVPNLRPGASPNDPGSYPFLPPNMSQPVPGQRSHNPRAIGSDLALGRPYTIQTQWPDPLFHKIESNWPNTGQLTDGQLAPLSFSSHDWVAFLRQYGRSITVDLGKVENIHAVSLDMLQNLGAGIDFPDGITYDVSQDGIHWTRLGTARSKYGGGNYTAQTQSFELLTNVNARYVRAVFTNKVFGFADEFTVDGYKTANPAARTPSWGHAQPWSTTTAGYMSPLNPHAGGIHNMLLAYTGTQNGTEGIWSESDFEPMVVHENAAGKAGNWMFDGMLIAPYGSMQTSSSAISAWIKNIFTKNIQLSALNQAVAVAKQKMNDPNYKEKVVINIPQLNSDPSNFGSIVPGGVNLDLNPKDVGQQVAYENKVQVIRWFIRQINQQWHAAHLTNLQLTGMYWQPESLIPSEPMDKSLVRKTAQLVHRDHKLFYWIPYYGAVGVTQAKSLGFDAVMIQPNVSFNWGIDASARLKSVADMAKQYGMGVEIEAHWDVTSPNTGLAQVAQEKYYDYFSAGNDFGFEHNVIKSYYENSKTLVTAYQSSNPLYHQVYDKTNQFIQGLWTNTSIQ